MAPSELPFEIEFGFERDDFVLPEESHEATRALADGLSALGFERLGVKWERGTPVAGAEPRLMRSPSYANPGITTFASIWFNDAGVPKLYFLTPFQSGECVFTSAYPREHHARTRHVVMTGTTGLTLAEVLELHRGAVKEFQARGLKVFAGWGKRERLAANDLYYRNPDTEFHLSHRHNGAVFFHYIFTAAAGVSFLVWLLMDHPAPLARAIAATGASAMVGSHWYTALAFPQRGAPWHRRLPILISLLGAAMLAWLFLRA